MKTYNIILKKNVDYESFWNDMENENDGGNLYIPNRRVESPNSRPHSERQTWYKLLEEEVELLKKDKRVLSVEIPPEFRDDIFISPMGIQEGNFYKTKEDSGEYHNWGLIRTLFKTNIYGNESTTNQNFTYTLTGNGVDLIIQDSGIQIDHPEFEDEDGNSRFESVDWSLYNNNIYFQSETHDRDFSGHGTHVAGIAVGKTFGWARNAKIIHQKINGLEGAGDYGNGIPPTYAFDAIKAWHTAKPINPKTGFKRPTVLNISWKYLSSYTNVDYINYRGKTYSGNEIDTVEKRNNNYGLITKYLSFPNIFRSNRRVFSVDTDIEELLEAGVHVCIAAGNNSHKIDEPGGIDFDNNLNGFLYYHRGSSPYGDAMFNGAERGIIVGNLDSNSESLINDQKSISSETGPGVDIYAPGTNIMSCVSNINRYVDGEYYSNSSYRQSNLSGTSAASPQVAGVLACILELNPEWTPTKAKKWLLDNAGSTIFNDENNNDWVNNRSLKGGSKKILHMPYKDPNPLTFSGFKNLTFNSKIKEL